MGPQGIVAGENPLSVELRCLPGAELLQQYWDPLISACFLQVTNFPFALWASATLGSLSCEWIYKTMSLVSWPAKVCQHFVWAVQKKLLNADALVHIPYTCVCRGAEHLQILVCFVHSGKIWPVLSQAEPLKLKFYLQKNQWLFFWKIQEQRGGTDKLGQILCQLFLKQTDWHILQFGLYLCLPGNFLSFFKERDCIFLKIDLLLIILCCGGVFLFFKGYSNLEWYYSFITA